MCLIDRTIGFKAAVLFVGFMTLASCNRKKLSADAAEKVVARAGTAELGMEEFREDYVSTGVVTDSAFNARRSIESWAVEVLFYQEALEKLSEEELAIEKQVEDYRRSLVNYIYQVNIIDANLDTTVSNDEIQEYYDNHRESFILKENILKVIYFKVPLIAPGLDKIKRLIGSDKPKDVEQLTTLCIQNAETFFMNDSTWLFLDEIKNEMPRLRDEPDFNLSPGRVIEFNDEMYYYYLKVKDVKIKNGLSPLNFERQNIRKFILNNRKSQMISTYKKMMLEKARAEKKFVIY